MTELSKTVCLITPGGVTAPGGIARMSEYHAQSWNNHPKYRVTVIDTYGSSGKSIMLLYFLKSLFRFFRLLFGRKVSLLHINLSQQLSVWRKGTFVLFGKPFRVPIVMHIHGSRFADYVMSRPYRRKMVGFLLRRCDIVVVLGSYWRDFVVTTLNVDPARVRIVHNAVPADMRKTAERRPGECKFLFLGAVGERKGTAVLLQALADPLLSNVPWKATIAGNGEIERHCDIAGALGLNSRVGFTGLLDREGVCAALAAADVLVLPSRNEGLPMAIIEAMSYGCAIVATPVGSIPDVVKEGETGMLTPVGDAAALAEILARLAQDAPLRRRLGENARRLYFENFTIECYTKKMEDIYDECLGLSPWPQAPDTNMPERASDAA